MSALKTRYEFTLPRGYVDGNGQLHTTGTMRLATARDELDPLRDPTVTGPDDPRLTILVLSRVIEALGSLEMVTSHDIENLFAVDLAFLQDFYGVINFGSQAEYEELIRTQAQTALVGGGGGAPAPAAEPDVRTEPGPDDADVPAPQQPQRPAVRAAVEEIRRETS